MDAVVRAWEYVVLVDPGGYPPRVLKTHVDDALPELETLFFGRSMQAVPVVSRQSVTAVEARELSRRCRGDVLRLEVDVPHPTPWNPPLTVELDSLLREGRGVDDPEEEGEYDLLPGAARVGPWGSLQTV